MRARERARKRFDAALVWLQHTSYLRKWLVLGILIGIVAGTGAVVFVHAIRVCSWLFLEVIGGYTPPSAAGEGAIVGSSFARPWAIPLAVGLGGLISGVIVNRFAPEAEGHGTDAAIEAVHRNPRGVRARASVVKIVASAVTIGSGGSAGREGPTAQVSAGFASLLARRLDLTPTDARIAVTAGIGSGIGAIFRAPLGGAVLGAEILYRDDIEAEAIFPTFVASITGFAIFAAFEGFTPIFGYLKPGHFNRLSQLPIYAIIGLSAGLVGVLYAKFFYGMTDRFRALAWPTWLKPAVAGVAVGLVGLAIPAAMGTGYGFLQLAMSPSELSSMALWMVLLIPFAKILTTSLSIGSGGSGGIFGPGMVIGGFVGAGIWLLARGMPSVPVSPMPFVVVGMTACFGSVAHAPLAMILMVAEMTGTLELVLPAMIAIGLASLVAGDRSIYEHQLKDRRESPGHRFRTAMPLLAGVPVVSVMAPASVMLDRDLSIQDARRQLDEAGAKIAAVVDGRGVFQGSVSAVELEGDERSSVHDVCDETAPAVPRESTLEDAVEALAASGADGVWVLEDSRTVIGIVTASRVINGYRIALRSNMERMSAAPPGTSLVEITVPEDSPLIDQPLKEGRLPAGTVLLAIRRGGALILPGEEDPIHDRDRLELLVPDGQEPAARRLVQGSAAD